MRGRRRGKEVGVFGKGVMVWQALDKRCVERKVQGLDLLEVESPAATGEAGGVEKRWSEHTKRIKLLFRRVDRGWLLLKN